MKILHLSDLHYTVTRKAKYVEFIDKIATDIVDNFESVDLVIISGDLVDKFGNGDFEKTINEIYLTILDMLIKIGIDDSHLICIPGNHEVNIKKYSYIAQKEIKDFIYTDVWSVNNLIKEQVANLASDGNLNDNFRQIEDFYKFSIKNLNWNYCVTKTPFYTCYRYPFDKKQIGVLGLNSAWYSELHGNNNYGKIILGVQQLTDGLDRLKDCDIIIGLSHFSLSNHHESERVLLENKVIENFDIFLTGHSHYNTNNIVQKCCGLRNTSCLINSAPSLNYANYLSDTKRYSLGYDIIEIKANKEIDIYHRTYAEKLSKFVRNTLIADDGISKYKLINDDIHDFISIRDILNEQKLEFDKSLISNTIDTKAPKCIEDIFINPALAYEDIEKDKRYRLIEYSELMTNNENVIIFGSRESGKSTLLHRIFSHYLNTSLEAEIYPFFLDYSNLKQDNFKDLIKQNYKYIGKLEPFFSTNEIVFLIDNFDTSNTTLIESMNEYVKNIKCAKIILSSNSTISGEVPIDFYDSLLVSYMRVKIKPLTADKVEVLTKKWFVEPSSTNDEIINTIVLFSKENYVPTYPIFISMLLWLSEQKKNMSSFSNALLIENFVEKLLEKHSPQQYLCNEFDYQNKKTLLIEIAEYIHNNGECDISNQDFYSIIIKNLKDRNFTFNVDNIANDLINSGILTLKNDHICFRYSCIYSYFISLKLSVDKEYFDEILTGDDLYYYVNEIDILTALNRNRIDVIEKIENRLDVALKEVKDSLNINFDEIDDFFKREFMLAPLINEKLMSPEAKALKKQVEKSTVDELLLASEEKNTNHMSTKFKKVNKLAEFERIWILSARVLRNLDDYKDNQNKIVLLDKILDAAIIFVYLFNYSFFKNHINSEDSTLDNAQSKLMLLHFLLSPYAIETYFQMNIGSKKLKKTFIDYEKEYHNNASFEKNSIKMFMINFLLVDNCCFENNLLKKYVNTLNESYLIDNTFVKLTELYHNSDSKDNIFFDSLQVLVNKNKSWQDKEKAMRKLMDIKKSKMLTDLKKASQ